MVNYSFQALLVISRISYWVWILILVINLHFRSFYLYCLIWFFIKLNSFSLSW